MVVVVDGLGDGKGQLGVAESVGVEVFGDHLGVEGRSVREGHVVTQLEGVLGGVGIHLPLGGNPRLDVEGLGVLVSQSIGDVVDQGAVGVETAGGRVEGGVRLVLEVRQVSTHNRLAVGAAGRLRLGGAAGDNKGEGQRCGADRGDAGERGSGHLRGSLSVRGFSSAGRHFTR